MPPSQDTPAVDPDYRAGIIASSYIDQKTPVIIWADPAAHRLFVTATVTAMPAQARRIFTSGMTNYLCRAAAGSAANSPVWQVKKIVSSASETDVTWADGDTNFDNVATDLATVAALSYS